MILRGPRNVEGEFLEGRHGGLGPCFVRTLLDGEFSSSIKFIRDLTLPAGSSIGEHPHLGDEELFFIIEGTGRMRVDGEEQPVCAGDIVLTESGSRHALLNTGETEMRILVVCAEVRQ